MTVAVLPLVESPDGFDMRDVAIRTTKGSGKGGQHRNKTETDVIAKHLPTGIEARCCSERSQLQNKVAALAILASRVRAASSGKAQSEQSSGRKQQIGSGMRGDKIRTVRVQDGIVKCDVTGRKKPLASYLGGDIEF